MYKRVLVILIFTTCFATFSEGFISTGSRCRRRTTHPPYQLWAGWVSWTGCTKTCGPEGTMQRNRERLQYGSSPDCERETEIIGCNRNCLNNGEIIDHECYCPGTYGSTCCNLDCYDIDNCDDVQCSISKASQNQYCLKCAYDRGEGKKAYEPVTVLGITNRECEKRCSWRPDSKFCYPGTCTGEPSTCQCANGFTGDNCLTITEGSSITECTVTFERPDYASRSSDCKLQDKVYCSLRASAFAVDWTVGYSPSGLPTRPYYVHKTVFGIIEAFIEWTLTRAATSSTSTGQESCFDADSAIDVSATELPSRSCFSIFDISAYNVQDGDELSLSLGSRNSGYIKLKNHDDDTVVSIDPPISYVPNTTVSDVIVVFDFIAPVHCISTTMPCVHTVLDIGNPYTDNNDIPVSWTPGDWNDLNGIDYYKCEAFRLAVDLSSQSDDLDMAFSTPHASQTDISPSTGNIVLSLPEPGIYSIVLTVFDVAGNSERARKFVIFDDTSDIDIDANNPITAEGAAFNEGVVWIPVVAQKATVKWGGHFYNAFHRDNKLLNAIKDTDPPMTAGYDEVTGQPPTSRSREAIPNVDGIVSFEFDYADANSDKTAPEWANELIDAPQSEKEISISASNGEGIIVWMRAYDVFDNEKQDKAYFYVDSTPPIITEIQMQDSSGNDMSMDGGIMDFNYNIIIVKVSDQESGIHKIKWEIRDAETTLTLYAEGEVTQNKPSDGDCTSSSCNCIGAANMCFYSDYVINTESATMMEMPDDDVECVILVFVYNNAMLERKDEMTLMVRAPRAAAASGGGSGGNAGAIAGGVIVAIIIILVVAIVIVMWRMNKLPRCLQSKPPPIASEWSGATGDNAGHMNPQFTADFEEEVKPKKNTKLDSAPPRPPKTNDYSTLHLEAARGPKIDSGAALTVEEMEFPSSRIELRELLQPGIFRANADNIGGSRGQSSVAVKTLKDHNKTSQRDSLLHELDIMLAIIPHENVIRLMGCITTRGSPKPSIIMEFAPYDNLSQVLRRSRQVEPDNAQDDSVYGNLFEGSDSLTSQKLLMFCEQVARGMEHISSLGIIHRKLGARNVFVGDNEVCKIGSFSKAIHTDRSEVQDKQEKRLPIRWMASESLTNHVFSSKSDVWAYGIVLWEIVTLGALPYTGMKNKEISERVIKGYRMEKPPHCTQELFTVMLRCWNKRGDRRPGFSELVQEVRSINKHKEVVNLSQYDSDLYGDIDDM